MVFLAAGGVVWVAGVKLSENTDVLAKRLGLGEALGGVVLLAIATNLPEIAITISAAVAGDLGIAVGNILGGIAVQTVVLAVLDACTDQREPPLTYQAASLVLVLEAALVVAILVLVVMGSQLPASAVALHLSPASVAIAATWLGSLWLLNRTQKGLPWHAAGEAPDGQQAPRGHSATKQEAAATEKGMTTRRATAVLAMGDIFGGNAFLPVLSRAMPPIRVASAARASVGEDCVAGDQDGE